MERFNNSALAGQWQTKITDKSSPFIWAIAILLVVIFVALYINIKTNNETILRTNLMKSTAQVADNIELRLTNTTTSLARLIERSEASKADSSVLLKNYKDFFAANPEVVRLVLINSEKQTLGSVQTEAASKTAALDAVEFHSLPEETQEAVNEAFGSNRITFSTFYLSPDGLKTAFISIVYPFTMHGQSYAFLARVSLDHLLENSIPNILLSDFGFSLVSGTERIAGRAEYNSPGDYTIPSFLRTAEPLPPTIQLYGANLVDSPLILASPLLFWLGCLMLFLLVLLFFLNKKTRKNQQALEEAEREIALRRSIEFSSQIGMIVTDKSSRIIYVNARVTHITGYGENELVGKEAPYPFWGDNTLLPSSIINSGRLQKEDFPYRFDLTIRRKNSEMLKGLLLVSPFYSQKMEHIGWIYLLRDNTFDFNSQTLVNDTLASYQKLLDSVGSCISVVTQKPSGAVLGIRNSAYKNELGATVQGHLLISNAFKASFGADGKRQEEVWVEDLNKWFAVTEARVTLPGGSHVTLQTAQDITDKKITEKTMEEQTTKMENSSRLVTLGEMASTITHEINQPLTAIVAYTSTAIEVLGNAPVINKNQVLEIFGKIFTQANRIDKIIKNIRSFAKRRNTMLEPTPLANVLADTVELGKLIEKKYNGVSISYQVPRELPTVMCDPVQIVQILMNLIRNSADAITESNSEDKTITVKVERLGCDVRLSVSDHGPGISDTMKASLFTPFFSTKKNGLGLGLSTCKTIAESHNTRLNVRDNDVQGVIFSFELKVV